MKTFLWLLIPFVTSSHASAISIERLLERVSLDYFLEQTHPTSGLVRDRARNFSETPNTTHYAVSSIAATGFGLAVVSHAGVRGLVVPVEAYNRVLRTLTFVEKHLSHKRGWLYHFVDWEKGERFRNSEISTIDTALFIAGALYAAESYPNTEVAAITQRLYERLDFFDMLTDGGTQPQKLTLSMGWTPEEGYLKAQWNSYSELLILVLLGLGHPNPLPKEVWSEWERVWNEPQRSLGFYLPLFVHQYSHLFVDFRGFTEGDVNFFENSRQATLFNRRTSLVGGGSRTYHEGFWGLSAGDAIDGYAPFSPAWHDGTVCPSCAGASAMFLPVLVLSDMQSWLTGRYGNWLWGRYGMTDSLNLDQNWKSPDAIGITVGALYLSLANLSHVARPNEVVGKTPALRRAFRKLGQARIVALEKN